MKVKVKRVLSGVLTAVTLLSMVLQPVVANAATLDSTTEKPPLYEDVKDLLDADEVVTEEDYEVVVASSFDSAYTTRNWLKDYYETQMVL